MSNDPSTRGYKNEMSPSNRHGRNELHATSKISKNEGGGEAAPYRVPAISNSVNFKGSINERKDENGGVAISPHGIERRLNTSQVEKRGGR